jgi:hypothetical protein
MTTQQLLRRILPTTAALIIILLLALSCSLINNDAEVPQLRSPNDTFVELGTVRVTNETIYHELVDQFGLRVMNSIITRDLLTSGPVDFVQLAKNDVTFDIQIALEEAIYGVPLSEALTTLTESERRRAAAEFTNILSNNGFATVDAFKEELYLQRARELYTKGQILSNNQITGQEIATYYESNSYNEVCAIVIRYNTLNAAVAALRDVGLDVTDTGEFVDVPFEEPLLQAYITLYNNAFNKNIQFVDGTFTGCDADMIYDFETVSKGNPALANLLFRELSGSFLIVEDAGLLSSFTGIRSISRGRETGFYIVQKISGDEPNSFRRLFPDIQDLDYQATLLEPASAITTNTALINELIEKVAVRRSETPQEVQTKMNQLLQANQLSVFDPYLRLAVITGLFSVPENQGHPSIVFRYERNGTQISVTADEFFVALQRYAPTVLSTVLNQRISLAESSVYDATVTRELQNSAAAQLQTFKNSFFAGEYEQFGFSPQQITWPQFIYLAFSYRSELRLYNEFIAQEVVEANFIRLSELPTAIDTYYDLMVERYNDFFSIDLIHLLIHRDDNNDGNPDPLLANNWTPAQIALANDFANLLRSRIQTQSEQEELTLASFNAIVTEYNEAFRSVDTDATPSVWLPFKEAGFLVRVENLNTVTPGMMVEPFENEARLMYNSMVVNVSRNLISANNVASQFGIHVIYANNFSPKLNAYPTNPSLSLPSRDDVRLFESGDQSGLSQDVIRFLNAYYVPAKTQYRDSFRTVFFNEELNNIGTLKFNDTAQLVAFNEFVRASARQALIQFDPRSI